MNEFKRKILFGCGVVLTVVSALVGVFTVIAGAAVLMGDSFSIGGDTSPRNYPNGAADSNFLVGAMPYVITAVVAYLLGAYLRENNRKLD